MGRQSKPQNLVVVMSYKLNVFILNVKATTTRHKPNTPDKENISISFFALLLFWFFGIMYYNKQQGREGQEISLINIDMLEVLFSVCSWTDKMLTPNQLRSVNIFVWIGTRIALAGLGVEDLDSDASMTATWHFFECCTRISGRIDMIALWYVINVTSEMPHNLKQHTRVLITSKIGKVKE